MDAQHCLDRERGWPRLPSGAYGAISITKSAHGTTRFISSRNSRLRVRLVDKFSPRSACFMRYMLAGSTIHCKQIRRLIVQSIPWPAVIFFLIQRALQWLPKIEKAPHARTRRAFVLPIQYFGHLRGSDASLSQHARD
ncbi:hypothetical protein D9M70_614770 [compost metagenome]